MRLTKIALFIQPHNNVGNPKVNLLLSRPRVLWGLTDKKRDKPFAFRKNHIYL